MTKTEVKLLLRKYNIRPIKRLGQNFLVDQNIQKKIIDTADISKDDTVLEIGPGLGALTGELCNRAKKVSAIEKDKRFCGVLGQSLFRDCPLRNLELIHGDILKYNWCNVTRLKIIGNLPYYISSPILVKLIENRNTIDSINITVQKEFAERLAAKPGTKAYGSITCFLQFYARVEKKFTIKNSAFYPIPKVDSCFLKIKIREKPLFVTDEELLFKIIRASFEKRRKTILNSLHSSGKFRSKEILSMQLEKIGISINRRPETLSLQEFVNITTLTI